MTLSVKTSSIWQLVNTPHVKQSGVWKQANEVWVKQGGTWKQAYAAGGPQPFDAFSRNVATFNGNRIANCRLNTDGTVSLVIVSGNWYEPTTGGIGSSYWVKAHADSTGGFYSHSGDPLDTWLQLNVARTFGITNAPTSGGLAQATYSFQLAATSGGTVIATGHCDYEAGTEPP